jgi:hypothetical protein
MPGLRIARTGRPVSEPANLQTPNLEDVNPLMRGVGNPVRSPMLHSRRGLNFSAITAGGRAARSDIQGSVTVMSMTQSLLDFILNLLRDSDAKAAFLADPDRALADAGLSNVCSEDISDAMSYVTEYHPVALVGPREYNLGNTAVVQHAEDHRPEYHGGWHDHDYRPDPHAAVIQQLEYITNNYAYTDSHDTLVDKSVNQSIWNNGVLAQNFDDHSVTATDHSVAAGRDFDGTAVTGNHNIVGDDNNVGNTRYSDDHSIHGSFNDSDDHSIRNSFNGNNVADHGGLAGDGNVGAVTSPNHSTVATTGGDVDASRTDSHETTIRDSFNDSHDRDLHSIADNSHHTNINSGNDESFNDNSVHDNNNHESYNDDSAITHTHQEGLINANVSPAVNLPIEHNDVHIL